jgi:septum formation protein
MKIVLASASPRRQELLATLGLDFEVDPADIDEDSLTLTNPRHTAEILARAKAQHVLQRHPDALIIGGDTVVAYHPTAPKLSPTLLERSLGELLQLSKPNDEFDAERMLGILGGRTHVVMTGISLQSRTIDHTFSETTHVTFRQLSSEEISAYVRTGEPMDKAGAYGAQGMAGGFVDRLDGPMSNVIGLPIERLAAELKMLNLGNL